MPWLYLLTTLLILSSTKPVLFPDLFRNFLEGWYAKLGGFFLVDKLKKLSSGLHLCQINFQTLWMKIKNRYILYLLYNVACIHITSEKIKKTSSTPDRASALRENVYWAQEDPLLNLKQIIIKAHWCALGGRPVKW